ncbi:MAG: RNA-binding protein [bacterium]|nr:MAG: RNA-binding protein [bacterium]
MNIYVGNLASSVTDDELRQTFEEYGEVSSATVLKDRYTGESRGFGFVEMQSKSEAIEAIKQVDGKEMNGKRLIVNEARPRQDNRGGKRRKGGGGGGSRGRGHGGRW